MTINDNSNLNLAGLPSSGPSLIGLDSIAVEMPSDLAPISETVAEVRKKSVWETATAILAKPLSAVSYLFSWTPQARQARRDQALILFFKKLPNDLQAEVTLTGSESMQAQTIRSWLAGNPGRLSRIETLDLSRLGLQMIPEEIRYLTHLKKLNICENAISDLTPVCQLLHLEHLLASSNEISQIPPLTALSRLTELSIHSNRIRPAERMLERIPEKAREAFILGVQNQNLRGKVTIPDSWKTKTNLFSKLPDDSVLNICQFLNPREYRSISKAWKEATYPALLEQYKASPLLQRLIDPKRLATNPEATVRQVEQEISGMDLFCKFKLRNPYTLAPRKLEQAIRDQSLIRMFSKYSEGMISKDGSVAAEARRIRSWMENHRDELARCDYLGFQGLDLYVIPEEIKYFTGLRTLYLSQNKIQQVDALGSFVGLRALHIAGNQIQRIDALGSLVGLRSLDISGNQIQQIDALGSLVSLERLNISRNQIQQIDALGSLVGLEELDISGNQIQRIDALGSLVGLKELNISENKIQQVDALRSLVGLMNLCIWENQIQQIDALGSLVGLRGLNISGNQIQQIDALSSLVGLKGLSISSNRIRASDVDLAQFPEAIRADLKLDLTLQKK